MMQTFLRKDKGTNSEQKKKSAYFSSLCHYFNPREKKIEITATKKEIFHLLNKKCLSFIK